MLCQRSYRFDSFLAKSVPRFARGNSLHRKRPSEAHWRLPGTWGNGPNRNGTLIQCPSLQDGRFPPQAAKNHRARHLASQVCWTPPPTTALFQPPFRRQIPPLPAPVVASATPAVSTAAAAAVQASVFLSSTAGGQPPRALPGLAQPLLAGHDAGRRPEPSPTTGTPQTTRSWTTTRARRAFTSRFMLRGTIRGYATGSMIGPSSALLGPLLCSGMLTSCPHQCVAEIRLE